MPKKFKLLPLLIIMTLSFNCISQETYKIEPDPFRYELYNKGYKIEYTQDTYTLVSKDDKYGVIQNSKFIIPCKYDGFISLFKASEKVSVVRNNKEFFLIDTKDNKIGNSYEYIDSFLGNIFIAKKGQKYLLINEKGKEVSKLYDNMEFQLDSSFKVKIGNSMGIISSDDKIIIPIEYESLEQIPKNLYIAKKTNFGIIDTFNKIIIPFAYESISSPNYDKGDFYENLRVTLNERNGVINLDNEMVIAPQYDKIIFMKNYLKVMIDSKYGVVDKNNNLIIPCQYDELHKFDAKERFRVSKDKLWGIIDNKNKIIIPFMYKNISKHSYPKINEYGKDEYIYKVSIDGLNNKIIDEKNDMIKE